MSTHSTTTLPAAPDRPIDERTGDHRSEALAELWQVLQALGIASRAQASRMAADHGLSNSQFMVLTALSGGGPMTMGQIGEQSDLPTSSLTALVDRLVELGMARRFAHPSDRRAIQVQLTDGGCDLAGRIRADTLQATAQIIGNLEDRQIDEASDVMRKLLAGYEQYVPRPGPRPGRPPVRRGRADQRHHPDEASSTGLSVPERADLDGGFRAHHDGVIPHTAIVGPERGPVPDRITPPVVRDGPAAGRS